MPTWYRVRDVAFRSITPLASVCYLFSCSWSSPGLGDSNVEIDVMTSSSLPNYFLRNEDVLAFIKHSNHGLATVQGGNSYEELPALHNPIAIKR